MDYAKRRYKYEEAFKILEDLSNAQDRLSVLRGFAFMLHDHDKLAEVAKLYDSGRVTKAELWDLLLNVYHSVNDPALYFNDLLRLFRDAVSAKGVVHFDTDPVPDKPIRLYRAAFSDAARGISWSWDHASAAKFLEPGKRIYTVVARPDQILGVFSKIGEREIMLDYELIDTPEEVP
jgi:hypothetical protein